MGTKKETISLKEKIELDKMWPKAEEYIILERPEGMTMDEYKTRQRHMREMEKFRKKYYGFEPVTKKTKKNEKNSKVLPGQSGGKKKTSRVSKGVQQKTFSNRKTG